MGAAMRSFAFPLFALLVLAAAVLGASGAAAQVTVLRGATLIDGSGAAWAQRGRGQ